MFLNTVQIVGAPCGAASLLGHRLCRALRRRGARRGAPPGHGRARRGGTTAERPRARRRGRGFWRLEWSLSGPCSMLVPPNCIFLVILTFRLCRYFILFYIILYGRLQTRWIWVPTTKVASQGYGLQQLKSRPNDTSLFSLAISV